MVKKKSVKKKVSKKNIKKKNSKDKGIKWVAGILGALLLLVMVGGFSSNFSSSGLTGYATAETDLIKGVFGELFNEFLSPIANLLFGVGTESSEIIFAKTLLFFAMLGLIWAVFSRIEFVEDNKTMSFIAISAISILAVRFLTEEIIINLIVVPTDTFIVAMITIVLFAGLFYFIEIAGPFKNYAVFRKGSWILVGVAFLGVWWTIRKDVGMAPLTYVIGFFAALLLFFLDGTISKSLAKGKVSRTESSIAKNAIITLQKKYDEFNQQLVGGALTVADHREKIRELDRAKKAIMRKL